LKDILHRKSKQFKTYGVKFLILALKSMLKYKMLIQQFVFNGVFIFCTYGDAILKYKESICERWLIYS